MGLDLAPKLLLLYYMQITVDILGEFKATKGKHKGKTLAVKARWCGGHCVNFITLDDEFYKGLDENVNPTMVYNNLRAKYE